MIKDIKFLATDVAPNPKEITHWVDLKEDSTGGIIKTFDGKEWKSITSSNSDSDKYVNMTVELNIDVFDEVTIDGKVYDDVEGVIYDTDLLNYLKDIYNSDKSLMVEYIEHANDGSIVNAKCNTYVVRRNLGESNEIYAISLRHIFDNVIIMVTDPSNKPGLQAQSLSTYSANSDVAKSV